MRIMRGLTVVMLASALGTGCGEGFQPAEDLVTEAQAGAGTSHRGVVSRVKPDPSLMSLPEPYIHPDDTHEEIFWSEDGVWWNADVVNGGTLDMRVYGRQYQSGTPVIVWIIDTREDELGSLETLLLEQAADDATTTRSLSGLQATEMNKEGNGNGHDGTIVLLESEDPIKSIKGMGENRANDLTSCLGGNASACSADLTTTYPRSPE